MFVRTEAAATLCWTATSASAATDSLDSTARTVSALFHQKKIMYNRITQYGLSSNSLTLL